MMVVALVFAGGISGITDASITISCLIPRTLHCWSTTACGSDAGPILQVRHVWPATDKVLSNQSSSNASDASCSVVGAMRLWMIVWKFGSSNNPAHSRTASLSLVRSDVATKNW